MSEAGYNEQLAKTVIKLLKTNPHPNVREIAEAHLGKGALGKEILMGLRNRLADVRGIIERKRKDWWVHTVGAYYYTHLGDPPASVDEARKFLPLGKGNMAIGIRRVTSEDDPIYQAWVQQNHASSSAKQRINNDRLITGVNNGLLGRQAANTMLANAVRDALASLDMVPEPAQIEGPGSDNA